MRRFCPDLVLGWVMTKTAERLRARVLRRAGHSLADIARQVGVSKSSASLWVRDLPVPPGLATRRADRGTLRRTYQARRSERQHQKLRHAVETGTLSDRDLLLVGAALYWAEGEKSKPWRPGERLGFINSDPDVIRVYCRWLDLLGVPDEDRRYVVSIHESADVHAAEQFWSDVVGIGIGRLGRTQLKRHNPIPRRRNIGASYRGCLVVRVLRGATFYRRMEGLWWAIAATGRRLPRPTCAEDIAVEDVSLDFGSGGSPWRLRKVPSRVV